MSMWDGTVERAVVLALVIGFFILHRFETKRLSYQIELYRDNLLELKGEVGKVEDMCSKSYLMIDEQHRLIFGLVR